MNSNINFIISKLLASHSLFLIIVLICNCLLASIFVTEHKDRKKINLFILALTIAAILMMFVNKAISFCALVAFALLVILAAVPKNVGGRKIMIIYGTVAKLALIALFLFTGKLDMHFIFYILLIPFLGLFPLHAWYVKFFENAPFNIIAGFVAFQAMTVWLGESLYRLDNIAIFQLLLAIFALISSTFSILQKNARTALAYLSSSQLAFLSFIHLTATNVNNLESFYIALTLVGAYTGFILILGRLERHKSDLSLNKPNGSYESYPKLSFWLFVFGLISVIMPFSAGYTQDLIFEGDFQNTPLIAGIWLLSIAVNAFLVIKIFLFLCRGEKKKEKGVDLVNKEIFITSLLFAAIALAIFLV